MLLSLARKYAVMTASANSKVCIKFVPNKSSRRQQKDLPESKSQAAVLPLIIQTEDALHVVEFFSSSNNSMQ